MHINNSKIFTHLKNTTQSNSKLSQYKISRKNLFFFDYFLRSFLIRGYNFNLHKKLIFYPNRKMFYLIKKIQLYSKPSNRKYIKFINLRKLIKKSSDFGLISTSSGGIVSFAQSVLLHQGGEIVFYSN